MYSSSLVQLLVLILIHAILEQSKQNGEQNLSWNVFYNIYLHLCKVYSLLWKPENTIKHGFLAVAILLFTVKIIII